MDIGELQPDALGDHPFLAAGVDEEQIFLPVVVEAEILAVASPGSAIVGTAGAALSAPFVAGARGRAIKARTRSSVSVVTRPPSRSRLTSLPSLTARRPNVDSAMPTRRQYPEISCNSDWLSKSSFLPRDPACSCGRIPVGEADWVNHNLAHFRRGQYRGLYPTENR
jgi:hypothetical protein